MNLCVTRCHRPTRGRRNLVNPKHLKIARNAARRQKITSCCPMALRPESKLQAMPLRQMTLAGEQHP